MKRDLVVVAPRRWHDRLRTQLQAAGLRTTCVARPRARAGADRFGVAPIAARFAASVRGLLLVADATCSPARCCPGPVVAGLPVGCLFADRLVDLRAWSDALDIGAGNEWIVAAPWNGHHLPLARRLQRRLRQRPHSVRRWTADGTSRDRLCQGLASGPQLAVYVGHATPRGLDAFGGVDLAAVLAAPRVQPCGTFAAFACRTLQRRGRQPGFAEALVAAGRTLTAFGAVGDVERSANATLAGALARLLAAGEASLGEALARLDRELAPDHASRQTLRLYRLIGLPVAPR